jgi:hypothetical protein
VQFYQFDPQIETSSCIGMFLDCVKRKERTMNNYQKYVSSTDRFGFIGTDEYKIERMSRKLSVPVEDVLKAIQEVGFDPDEVEEYIRDRYNRT